MGLICGSTDKRHTLGTPTNIFCPVCQADRSCKHKEIWRCCTLCFLPVKSHTKLAAYYKCQTCQTRLPLLDWSKITPHAALEHSMLIGMIRLRMANGLFRVQEATAVKNVYSKLMPHSAAPQEEDVLLYAMYMKKVSRNGIQEDLRPDLVQMLTDDHKLLVLVAMKSVTLQKKSIHKKEAKVIQQVRELFGVQ